MKAAPISFTNFALSALAVLPPLFLGGMVQADVPGCQPLVTTVRMPVPHRQSLVIAIRLLVLHCQPLVTIVRLPVLHRQLLVAMVRLPVPHCQPLVAIVRLPVLRYRNFSALYRLLLTRYSLSFIHSPA